MVLVERSVGGRRNEDSGSVDHAIDSAKGFDRLPQRFTDAHAVRYVDAERPDCFASNSLRDVLLGLLCSLLVFISNHDVCSETCELFGCCSSDAVAAADYQHDLAAELLFRRHAA